VAAQTAGASHPGPTRAVSICGSWYGKRRTSPPACIR
jgi:hypothetical protein